MAKWYGKIGYAVCEEETTIVDEEVVHTGIWKDTIAERYYYGECMKNTVSKWSSGEGLNDNYILSNIISILADPFAIANFHTIKYAELLGHLWKVTNVEVEYPRLKLTLGGVYNGEAPDVDA